jgi:glyoxylase-like metal-dependent hydrolase (beta-lactamase superfamily II)
MTRIRGDAVSARQAKVDPVRRAIAIGLTLVGAAVLAVLSTFRASPLPAPAPYDGPIPQAHPPPQFAVFQLPTGVTHRSAAFAYRGGSFFDARDFSMTALLVRHPQGDLLIDTGLGRDIATQLEAMPWWFSAITSYTRTQSAAELLDAAHYDRSALRGVVLTHAHWDHSSGLGELAGTPVWVPAAERRFIAEGGWITAVARGQGVTQFTEYAFEGGPYLGFPASHDVYGDGAIVIVPAPGHTPGSVLVFLNLPDGTRYALLGDLVWQREGITEREERPWVQRTLGDVDPAAVRDAITKVAALSARLPQLVLVPAHDQRGFAQLPTLPSP